MKFVKFIVKVAILFIVMSVFISLLYRIFNDGSIAEIISLIVYGVGVLIFVDFLKELFRNKESIARKSESDIQMKDSVQSQYDAVNTKKKAQKKLYIALAIFLPLVILTISADPRDPSTGLLVLISFISGTVTAFSIGNLIAISSSKSGKSNIFYKRLV